MIYMLKSRKWTLGSVQSACEALNSDQNITVCTCREFCEPEIKEQEKEHAGVPVNLKPRFY